MSESPKESAMTPRRRLRVLLVLIKPSVACLACSIGLLFGSLTQTVHGQTIRYDGHWWNQAARDAREKFVLGYGLCSHFDAGQRYLSGRPLSELSKAVTAHYSSSPREEARLAEEVLRSVGPGVARQKSAGENDGEKYGFGDGLLWRGMTRAERVGFLAGYLGCYRNVRPDMTFSKPTSSYVELVSRWYGVRDDDPSEIIDAKEDRKIPDVLRLFADAQRAREKK